MAAGRPRSQINSAKASAAVQILFRRFISGEFSKCRGFGPAAGIIFFREKDPQPFPPRSATLNGSVEKSRQRRSRHFSVLTYYAIRSARKNGCGLAGRTFLNRPGAFDE